MQRQDFGAAISDTDGDGLPDPWETLHFGGLGVGPNVVNLNGLTALQNYVAGTNPNDTNSLFRVTVATSNNVALVSFLAQRAEGVGYENRTRIYTLEIATDISGGNWQALTGYSNLPGDNQTITYLASGTNSAAFYRGRVSLP